MPIPTPTNGPRNYSTADMWRRDAVDDNGFPLSIETALNAQLPGDTCPACEGVGEVVAVIGLSLPNEHDTCEMCGGSKVRP